MASLTDREAGASDPQGQQPTIQDEQGNLSLSLSSSVGGLLDASTDLAWTSLDTFNKDQEDQVRLGDFESNGWHIPDSIARELVDIFFEKIQIWLPILHRPNFHQKYFRVEGQGLRFVSRHEVGGDDAFMINGIFALATRFSNADAFKDIPPLERAEGFVNRAATIKDGIIKTIEVPSLEFVKGTIILAIFHCTAGQMAPGALLTSLCVRFAYDLELDRIDEDQIDDDDTLNCDGLEDAEAWVQKEERRRLWWAIWENDTFIATLSRQPYAFGRGEMKVFLPVADSHWFSGTPVRSSVICHQLPAVCRSLSDSPNNSPRAWYLMSKYLMSCFAEAERDPQQVSPEKSADFESALCSLKLAVPHTFSVQSLDIDRSSVAEGIWIIATHLMILACETALERRRLDQAEACNAPVPGAHAAQFAKRMSSRLINIANAWPSEFIPLTHPYICCAALNPGATVGASAAAANFCYEVLGLILSHYARYWNLGNVALRLLTTIKQGRDLEDTPDIQDRDLVRRFSSLVTSRASKRRRTSSASPVGAQSFVQNGTDTNPTNLAAPWMDSILGPSDMPWPFDLWFENGDFPAGHSGNLGPITPGGLSMAQMWQAVHPSTERTHIRHKGPLNPAPNGAYPVAFTTRT